MKKYTGTWFWVLSPTFKIAERKKEVLINGHDGVERVTDAIKRYNKFYFNVSLALALICGVLFWGCRRDEPHLAVIRVTAAVTFGGLIVSRAVEIFAAFLIDAVEKLNGRPSTSQLGFGDRLSLALKSYLELMFGFGALYYLLPASWFKGGLDNIVAAIYFSAVTMTTVGYGDITADYWLTQALVVLQIFCSLILALVCFTVYTILALAAIQERNADFVRDEDVDAKT